MSQKLSRVLLLLTWLLPVVSSAPVFVANNVVEISGELLCLEVWPSPFDPVKTHTDYTIILFVLFYVFPLTVISFLYSFVIFKIWRRRFPGNRSTVRTEAYSRSRWKALKVFISVVVCFTLCWLPYHVTFFLSSYNEIYFNCDLSPLLPYFSHTPSVHSIHAYTWYWTKNIARVVSAFFTVAAARVLQHFILRELREPLDTRVSAPPNCVRIYQSISKVLGFVLRGFDEEELIHIMKTYQKATPLFYRIDQLERNLNPKTVE